MRTTSAVARLATAAALTALALGNTGGLAFAKIHSTRSSGSDGIAAFARFPQFANLKDSTLLTAPVMLHGVLTDRLGQPLRNAEVLLGAWPSNEHLRALEVGRTFKVLPIARTVTGARGEYVLKSLLTPALKQHLGKEGLDLEIDVFHAGRHHLYLSQVAHDPTSGGWVTDALDTVAGAPSTGAVTRNLLELALRSEGGPATPLATPRQGQYSQADHVSWPECSDWRKLPAKVALTTVATALASNGVRIETTYTSEASTQSSAGVSFNGGLSFSQEGSRSRSSNFTAAFYDQMAKPKKSIHREFQVPWRHHVEDRHCQLAINGPRQVQVTTSPDIATGGATIRKSRLPGWVCTAATTSHPSGARFVQTENSKARTYESAFSFIPVSRGVFSGSARSGYSEAAKITFHFGARKGGHWCGDSDFPTAPGQRVQAYR